MDKCKQLFEYMKEQLKDVLEFERYFSRGDLCTIDFFSRDIYDSIDCNFLCEMAMVETDEEFEECLKSCDALAKANSSGSITVDMEKFTVKESSMPVPCYEVMGTTWEETERKARNLANRIKSIGCEVPEDPTKLVIDFIHSHEFVRDFLGAFEPEEELPVVCYIHTKGNCSPVDLLKTVYG